MSCRILCYGDSNTYGYDPRSYLGGRYPESVRWTALLRARGWQVQNEGENGRSIPRRNREIDRAVQEILGARADAAVIMLGSNDLLQEPELTAEGCAERMERFLAALLRRAGREGPPRLLLAAPPPMKRGTWVSSPKTLEVSARLAACYADTARRMGLLYADAGRWGVSLTFDGVHFSESGHRAFAEGLARELASIFGAPG